MRLFSSLSETTRRRILLTFSFVAVAGVFFAGGYYVRRIVRMIQNRGMAAPSFQQIRQSAFSEKGYRYINPLLACEVADTRGGGDLSGLRQEITSYIRTAVERQDADAASVYFDRRDGHWLGVDTAEKYFPASLLKVPMMMAFYKEAEYRPEILKKKIVYAGGLNYNSMEYFSPAEHLEPGKAYTIEELIERMIAHSDNNALTVLANHIENDQLEEVLADLGLQVPEEAREAHGDFVTVKSYANFFRTLYNASYLNREMSEKAMALLTKAAFPSGITAVTPNEIPVAHKFGERNFGTNPNDSASKKELHDCGIVYYPGHPYLLCIMTKGYDFKRLSSVIQGISRIVYEYTDRQYGAQ